ncbi:hypothetical protein [Ralstonia sp. SET104]|uniref:hypothetical protein n=1 Tax=Ralstonia sp. SET104 TaxID=2448774 RepID=UPI000FF96B9C|nr:hypothetical protein [Ralstonia sp. SET104]GCB06473.1 hypothetical protein PSUB009319_41040 [Ralstonia sp. SET104]
MRHAEPTLTLEIRIASSYEVLEEFERGMLDAAVVLRHDARRTGGAILMEEPFGWPPLPGRSVVLHSRRADPVAKKALRTFASILRATAGR